VTPYWRAWWRGFARGWIQGCAIGWPIAATVLIVDRCAPLPAFGASCPDWDVPAASKVRVQFPGPCSPPEAFVHAVIDVGVGIRSLSETYPGVPGLLAPWECVWVERRWVGCLRSRCVAPTADVDPGEFSTPRGATGGPVPVACRHVWGTP